jgi:hypothetical protein
LKENEKSVLSEGYTKERSVLERQIAELTGQILQEGETHKITMIEFERAQQEILDGLREKLKQEHDINIDSLKHDHEKGILEREKEFMETKAAQISALKSTLKNTNVSEIESIKSQYEEKIKTSKQEMERYQSQAFDQVQQRFKKELAVVREQAISERECALQRENTLAQQLAGLKENLADSRGLTTGLNQKVVRLEEDLTYARRQMANVEKDRENVRLQLLSEVTEQREELEKMHKDKMVELEKSWGMRRGKMTQEFESIQKELHGKISDQEGQIKSWRERWAARGPRKEDQSKLQELNDCIKDKDCTISRLVDEKRFYQLELANRDQNFNKVFSGGATNHRVTSPLVGVMDPMSGQTMVNDRYSSNFQRLDFNSGNTSAALTTLKEQPPRRLDPIANPSVVNSGAPMKKFIRS